MIAADFLSAWNAGCEGQVDALAHPAFTVQYTHFGEPIVGIERFKHVLRQTHHCFPDLTILIAEMVAESDVVVVWWTYEGTHQREVLFDVQPSGRRVRVPGISQYRITGGKVIEERGIVDNLSLMMQLQGES
jgi:predicted ester cyclase